MFFQNLCQTKAFPNVAFEQEDAGYEELHLAPISQTENTSGSIALPGMNRINHQTKHCNHKKQVEGDSVDYESGAYFNPL